MSHPINDTSQFQAADRLAWRTWLQDHHNQQHAVWLVYFKKGTGQSSLSYEAAVEEALCFGWIDSTRRSLGQDRFCQYFCRRKAGSTWSAVNKARVRQLTAEGLMMPAGLAVIRQAQADGSWNSLDDVEALKIPPELAAAFCLYPGSRKYFQELPRSQKKRILHWLQQARRPETREKRITAIAEAAAAKQFPAALT